MVGLVVAPSFFPLPSFLVFLYWDGSSSFANPMDRPGTFGMPDNPSTLRQGRDQQQPRWILFLETKQRQMKQKQKHNHGWS
jgi:hypothetical protein